MNDQKQSNEDQYLTGADYVGEGEFYRTKNMYQENEAQREDQQHSYDTKHGFAAERKLDASPETRYNMIAEAAYLRAKNHNFAGPAVNYWTEAEAEIDDMLNGTGGIGDLPTSEMNQIQEKKQR